MRNYFLYFYFFKTGKKAIENCRSNCELINRLTSEIDCFQMGAFLVGETEKIQCS
jgi:hypothetical protein